MSSPEAQPPVQLAEGVEPRSTADEFAVAVFEFRQATDRLTSFAIDVEQATPDEALQQLVGTLAVLTAMKSNIEQSEQLAVELVRAKGNSWRVIADALGLKSSTAHRRYDRVELEKSRERNRARLSQRASASEQG